MKKSFLLFTAGLTIATAVVAQESSSIMLNGNAKKYAPGRYDDPRASRLNPSVYKMLADRRSNYAAKTTNAASVGGWFSFDDAHDNGTFVAYDGSTDAGNYGQITVFNDSTLYVPAGTPPFYWWCHGLGTSFDPTSPLFSSLWVNTTVAAPAFIVAPTDPYFVDSIFILGRYFNTHSAAEVDTLHIDVTNTGGSALTWDLHLANSALATAAGGNITVLPDTTYLFAEAAYDSNGLQAGVTPRYRILKTLDAAASIDTTTAGWNAWAFPINGGTPGGGMSVPAGDHVVALTTFHASHYYPHGTNIDSANVWTQSTWSFSAPSGGLQDAGDFNTGLLVSTAERYNTTSVGTPETYSGNVIPSPAYFWTPSDVHNPYYWFYIRSPHSTEVQSTVNQVKNVNVYPNPATTSVNIRYELTNEDNVTITLTNLLGQVVGTQKIENTATGNAVFNTAALTEGIYIYTFQATGMRFTGRIVVAH